MLGSPPSQRVGVPLPGLVSVLTPGHVLSGSSGCAFGGLVRSLRPFPPPRLFDLRVIRRLD